MLTHARHIRHLPVVIRCDLAPQLPRIPGYRSDSVVQLRLHLQVGIVYVVRVI